MNENKSLTTAGGAPVADNRDILTAGPRGPLAMTDAWFLEKMAHFDREVIPERRVHAKGSGAFGKFTVTGDITGYTKAALFSEVGKETEVFVRFATSTGECGAVDAERDGCGFALKFYTEEGNWDLAGQNSPVFFIRDPMLFPDLQHAVKRDPCTNVRSPQSKWDFLSSLPEALHQVTFIMGDRGLPDGYRHMHGFGVHAFSFYNRCNQRSWVKFHFRTQQGIQCLTNEQAGAIIAKDRESSQNDLFHAIESGDFPRWTMYVQIMGEQQAKCHRDNPFDPTKIWSQQEFPLIEVGVLELNRNPENYFADVEQSAFNPANAVPGIGHSPDKLLQGRLFSYGDAQRYRLGVNYMQIPVNAPKCYQHCFHRDGLMRVDGNFGATVGYCPNGDGQWAAQASYGEPPLDNEGAVERYSPYEERSDDCYSQPGALYRLMAGDERARLVENTAGELANVTDNVKYRHAAHCYLADEEYGMLLAGQLGLSFDRVMALAGMPLAQRLHATGK